MRMITTKDGVNLSMTHEETNILQRAINNYVNQLKETRLQITHAEDIISDTADDPYKRDVSKFF